MRKKTAEEKIRELEENREDFIRSRVEAFEKRLRASYQAKIDLLRAKGLKPRVPPRKDRVAGKGRTLKEMSEKGRDRYVFYREKYYEHMGLSPDEAHEKAVREAIDQQERWLQALTA